MDTSAGDQVHTGGDELALGDLTRMAELLLTTETVEDLLAELVTAAADLVPGGSCSITIVSPRGQYTVATSDSRAAQVDEVQYGMDEGPCLEAIRSGVDTDVPDMAGEDRWRGYPAYALSHGVASCHVHPLRTHDEVFGAMNVYAPVIDAFGEHERAASAAFAAAAASLIAVMAKYVEKAQLSEQLQTALTSRTIIDQAIGVIIGQQRVGPEDAFAVLRRASQNRNVKLRDIAAQVVQGYARPGSSVGQSPASST